MLNESATAMQFAGVLMIFVGALFVISTEGFKINKKLMPALMAYITWTVFWMILTEAITATSTFPSQMLISRIIALVLALIFFISKGGGSKSLNKLSPVIFGIGILIGVLDGSGDTLFAYTIHTNLVALGAAITALGPLLVAVFSYFIFRDRLTKAQTLGFAIMILGALVIALL